MKNTTKKTIATYASKIDDAINGFNQKLGVNDFSKEDYKRFSRTVSALEAIRRMFWDMTE